MSRQTCTCCGAAPQPKDQWWYLNGYYGLRGYFCPKCYDAVSHDSYGKPKDEVAYRNILNKLTLVRQEGRRSAQCF